MLFAIRSVNGEAVLEFQNPDPKENGWIAFEVALRGPFFNVLVSIEDMRPEALVEYFRGLETHWKGWPGERRYEAMEAQLSLVATADALGHVALRVSLRDDLAGADWTVSGTLTVEAGQLSSIVTGLKQFFSAVRDVG